MMAQRSVTTFAAGAVLAALVAPEIGPAVMLLAVLGALVAGYPARRLILEETWGLPGYLNHAIRFWTAMLGAWFLLAATPAIVHRAGTAALPLAAVLIALVFAWGRAQALAFPWILRARPLRRPELAARFDGILARARCRRPRVYEAAARGGRWLNGIAVPSLLRPSIVMTTDLLDELTPQESTAIFAHEIGHLEQFNRKRLLAREAVGTLACVALVGMIAWLKPGSEGFGIITWVWPLMMVLILLRTLSGSQGREHDSDLRAVELIGDPEVVASALTKIHQAMRLPRRWQARTEGRQTHPSLARRLRAIREAGGGGVAPAEAASATSGSDAAVLIRDARRSGDAMLLGDDRLYWLRGLPAAVTDPASAPGHSSELRAVRYEELADLRLDVDPSASHLTAVDGEGKTTRLRLAPGDVARVKAALDRTEVHVGSGSREQSAEHALHRRRAARARIWALVAAIAALTPPVSFPLGAMAAVTVWRPAGVAMLAAGVIGLGATCLHLLGGQTATLSLALQAAISLVLLLESWNWRRRRALESAATGRVVLWALAAMGLFFVISGLGRIASAQPALHLHLWARYEFGLTLVLLAASAALWYSDRRRLRPIAAGVAAMAGVLLVAGSGWFAHRFAGDPLSEPARLTPARPLSLGLLRELELDERVIDLRVSPSGRRVAVATPVWDLEGETRPPFMVEKGPEEFIEMAATDLAFLTDDIVVSLAETSDERLRLETRDLRAGAEPDWGITLPAMAGATLRLDPGSLGWEIAGSSVQGRTVLVTGRIGETHHEVRQVKMEEPEGGYLSELHASTGGEAVAVVNHVAVGHLGALGTLLLSFNFSAYPMTSELWTVNGSASRRIVSTGSLLTCAESRRITASFACVTTGPSPYRRVLSVDAVSGEVRDVAVIPSDYYAVTPGLGDRLLAASWSAPPLLLAPSSGAVWRLEIPRSSTGGEAADPPLDPLGRFLTSLLGYSSQPFYYQAAALGETAIGIAAVADQRSRIAIFRLDG
jgi:Zn-dependent protease with chaperone function